MSKLTIPYLEPIKRFDAYSNNIQISLIKKTLKLFKETATAVFLGRILTLAAVFMLGPNWLKVLTLLMFAILSVRQHTVMEFFSHALTSTEVPLKRIKTNIIINGILRNLVLAVTYIGLSYSEIPLAAQSAALFLSGHLSAYIYQHSFVPRAVVYGLLPVSICVLGVTSAQIMQTGEFALAFGVIFIVFAGLVFGSQMSSTSLDMHDLNCEVEEQAKELQKTIESYKSECDLREELEYAAGVGTFYWLKQENSHFWSRGTFKLYGREFGKTTMNKAEFFDRISPANRDEFTNIMSESGSDAKPFSFDFTFRGEDEIMRHLNANGQPFYDDSGNLLGMRGILKDETAIRLSLANNESTTELLVMALESSKAVVLQLNAQTNEFQRFGRLHGDFEHVMADDPSLLSTYEIGLGEKGFKKLVKLAQRAEKTNTIQSSEFKFKYTDNSEKDIRIIVKSEGNPSIGTGRHIYFVLDICEEVAIRKELSNRIAAGEILNQQLESTLKDLNNEAVLREELEVAARIGTYEWLVDGTLNISKGGNKILGRSENAPKIVIEDSWGRVKNQNPHDLRQVMLDAIINHTPYNSEISYEGDDGIVRHICLNGRPSFDEQQNLIGFKGIIIDQTELTNALNKTNETHDLLQMALRSTGSIVLVRNFDRGTMEGYGALEEMGFIDNNPLTLERQIFDRLAHSDKKLILLTAEKAARTGQVQTSEHGLIMPDGTTRAVRFSVINESKDGGKTGQTVSITNDISKEVERRQALSAAVKEARNASKVKSEFLANMSHEIRTPLNGVIAVAGLLARTKLDENQREMVEMVENSGESLKNILNDILDIARVESGRMEIEKIDFNLEDSLKSVTALFAVKADEKGLALNLELEPQINSYFVGDPARIRQILTNFLSNAVKFTQTGTISLRGSLESDHCCGKCDNLHRLIRFEVQDSGMGLAPEDLARLFNRFEQIDGSITREHGGSGLGLSISKALAELMGGTIEAKSELGKGSVFSLLIPLEVSHMKNDLKANIMSEIVNENVPPEKPLNILGVDDNATNRRVLEITLAPMGVNLTLCENGQEAVEAFAQTKFDVVLMDLQMPVMDGLNATRVMRVQEKIMGQSSTPIIAVSANAMAHHIEEAIASGANSHLAKPFTPQSLIAAISAALECEENTQFEEGAFAA